MKAVFWPEFGVHIGEIRRHTDIRNDHLYKFITRNDGADLRPPPQPHIFQLIQCLEAREALSKLMNNCPGSVRGRSEDTPSSG